MYFPYLRGKQYEWIALRELSQLIADNKEIIPIIELVKENFSTLNRSLKAFKESKMPFIIIINPQVGELVRGSSKLIKELQNHNFELNKNAHVGFIIHLKTEMKEIKKFFKDYRECNICLIHYCNFSEVPELKSLISNNSTFKYNLFIESKTGRRYRRLFRNFKNVLIEDGFEKRRNQDYPPDEFFSDLHIIYKDEGYAGFGDFLIVGDSYSPTGGPAYAVAIHMTYINNEKDMWIKHFISESRGTPVDPAGKFLEALEKLVKYVRGRKNEIYISDACNEFKSLYRAQHFPGLGYVKKLSMKHHIELIDNSVL